MSQSSRDNNGIRSCFSGGNLDEEWDIATISRDHPTGKNVLHVLHEIGFFAQMNQIRRSLQSPSLFNSKNCLQSRSTLWNTRKFATKATNENKDTIEDEVQFIIYYFLLIAHSSGIRIWIRIWVWRRRWTEKSLRKSWNQGNWRPKRSWTHEVSCFLKIN